MLFAINCDCDTITCSENQCIATTINCADDGFDCAVTCSVNGCESATINCVNGYDCTVSLDGFRSARLSTINGNLATKLQIYTGTTGDFQLQNAHIYCPINGQCDIYCKGDTAEVCSGTTIHAESSSAVTLQCEQYNSACYQLNIWCPKHDTCTLVGEPTSTAAMTSMHVYSAQGFNTVTVEKGNTGISIGTMHCMSNYSMYCSMDPNGNNACSTVHICDNPPNLTTTIQPTTIQPTTFVPTTANPTTSMPTTTSTTSSQPTSNKPSTLIPTTSTPTLIPTTLYPTNIPSLSQINQGEITEMVSTLRQYNINREYNDKLSDNSNTIVFFIAIGVISGVLLCICVLVIILWRKKLKKNKTNTIIEKKICGSIERVQMVQNRKNKSYEMNIIADGEHDDDSDSEKLFGEYNTTVANTNTTTGNTTTGNTTTGNDLSETSHTSNNVHDITGNDVITTKTKIDDGDV